MSSGAVSVKRKKTSCPEVQLHVGKVVSLAALVVLAASAWLGIARSMTVALARRSLAGAVPARQLPPAHT